MLSTQQNKKLFLLSLSLSSDEATLNQDRLREAKVLSRKRTGTTLYCSRTGFPSYIQQSLA